jgi:hypothetical protein
MVPDTDYYLRIAPSQLERMHFSLWAPSGTLLVSCSVYHSLSTIRIFVGVGLQ